MLSGQDWETYLFEKYRPEAILSEQDWETYLFQNTCLRRCYRGRIGRHICFKIHTWGDVIGGRIGRHICFKIQAWGDFIGTGLGDISVRKYMPEVMLSEQDWETYLFENTCLRWCYLNRIGRHICLKINAWGDVIWTGLGDISVWKYMPEAMVSEQDWETYLFENTCLRRCYRGRIGRHICLKNTGLRRFYRGRIGRHICLKNTGLRWFYRGRTGSHQSLAGFEPVLPILISPLSYKFILSIHWLIISCLSNIKV